MHLPAGLTACPCTLSPPSHPPSPQAGGGGGSVRLADLLDRFNAQAAVHVSEREVRQALGELEGGYRLGANGMIAAFA